MNPEYPERGCNTVTIWDVAKSRGVKEDENGSISGDEFIKVGLPMWGGCCICQASIAAYNAHPGKGGYLICSDCVTPESGFLTTEEFEKWCEDEDEQGKD